MLLKLITCLSPWPLKRWLLQRCFGYVIDPTARIGLAWVYPKHLRLGKSSRIDHFVTAVHLDTLELGDFSTIGRSTWITGHPTDSKHHFTHQIGRKSQLIVGEHTAITKRHYLDCTSEIRIGKFTTLAGHHSELLTHSIDVIASRQDSHPIEIGDYCFVGTRCVILGGAKLPPQSVLAAGAVLTKSFDQSYAVYGGVPARQIKELPKDAKYFHRREGFIS